MRLAMFPREIMRVSSTMVHSTEDRYSSILYWWCSLMPTSRFISDSCCTISLFTLSNYRAILTISLSLAALASLSFFCQVAYSQEKQTSSGESEFWKVKVQRWSFSTWGILKIPNLCCRQLRISLSLSQRARLTWPSISSSSTSEWNIPRTKSTSGPGHRKNSSCWLGAILKVNVQSGRKSAMYSANSTMSCSYSASPCSYSASFTPSPCSSSASLVKAGFYWVDGLMWFMESKSPSKLALASKELAAQGRVIIARRDIRSMMVIGFMTNHYQSSNHTQKQQQYTYLV